MDILGSMKQELLMDSPSTLSAASSLWTNPKASPPMVVQSRPVVSHLRKDLAEQEQKKSDQDPFQMLSMLYQQQQASIKTEVKSDGDPMSRDTAIMGSPSLSRIRAKKRRGRMMMMQLNSKKGESVEGMSQFRENTISIINKPRVNVTESTSNEAQCKIEDNVGDDVREKPAIICEDHHTGTKNVAPKSIKDTETVEHSMENSYESTASSEQQPVIPSKRERKGRKQKKTSKLDKRKREKQSNLESDNFESEDINETIDDTLSDENESDLEVKNGNSKTKDSGSIKIAKRRKRTPEDLEALKNKDRPFLCKFCGKTYLTKKNLRYHEACHSEERKYVCDYPKCGKSFKLNAHLKTHKYMHEEENRFVCSFEGCDKAYKTPDTLRLHEQIHQPGQYLCQFAGCGKSFPVKRGLSRHMRRAHQDNRKFPCTHKGCDRVCTSRSNLKEHMEGHIEDRERFTCKICAKIMMSEHTLKRHMKQVHCAERNFMCSICGKRYKTKSNLAQHINIHVKNPSSRRSKKKDSPGKDSTINNNENNAWGDAQSNFKDYYYDDYPVPYMQ